MGDESGVIEEAKSEALAALALETMRRAKGGKP